MGSKKIINFTETAREIVPVSLQYFLEIDSSPPVTTTDDLTISVGAEVTSTLMMTSAQVVDRNASHCHRQQFFSDKIDRP